MIHLGGTGNEMGVTEPRKRVGWTHRLAARGRSEETPAWAHLGVVAAVGVLVGAMLLVTLLLWVLLR